MSLLLQLDTAVESASVCLAYNGKILAVQINTQQNESASWIHTAIQQIVRDTGYTLQQIQAIAISGGPGSYTGLRIGMATAKGLCYALRLPLISINTLQMMAAAAQPFETDLACPMIDARRMEVFTALYTSQLQEVLPTQALILEPHSFDAQLEKSTITFFGNGSNKYKTLLNNKNAHFKTISVNASHLTKLAYSAYQKGQFSDLAYAEPLYGKEFFTPTGKH